MNLVVTPLEGTLETVWRSWVVHSTEHRREEPHRLHLEGGITFVIQGPQHIVVAGDLGDMTFHRCGGIGLAFFKGGARYVAEKCETGNMWKHCPERAKTDLLEFMQEQEDDAAVAILQRSDLFEHPNYEDPRAINDWVREQGYVDDLPEFGQTLSDACRNVLHCLEAVYLYDLNTRPTPAPSSPPQSQ